MGNQNLPSRNFGDYELLGELAEGGMGAVYYARQISLNRTVAIKMIRSGQLATGGEVQRFRAEAEAAANLDHPNIVPIYEIGEHEGQHYFSMKLMEGGTLGDLNSDCKLRDAQWMRRSAIVVIVIAGAVHHAHQRGVLHRDIKPTNILLDEHGEPYLTDFGLAKLLQDRPNFTQSLAVLGTPGYMAPEQAAGRTKQLTTAADIYSLGTILYELLTGRVPFKADSTLELLAQVQQKEPERPRKLNPGIDRDLETICLKCLEKDPERRYGTAESFGQDLNRWLAGKPVLARPAKTWERAVKWTRRNPKVAGLSMIAVFILISGLAGILFEWRRAQMHAVRASRNAERADANARESRERLVRSFVANGNRLVDEGDPFAALLWFAEALRLDSGNSERETNHRLRLAGVLRQSPKLLQVCSHGSALMTAAFSSDGKRMITAGRDNTVLVWDIETGKRVLGPLKHPHLVPRVSFIEKDQAILTASYNGDGARIWEAQDGKMRTFFEHKGMRWTTLSEDENWLLTWGGLDGQIKLWNTATGKLMASPVRHGFITRVAVFAPDGTRFATASSDRTVIIWDRATMKPVFSPLKQEGEVRSLTFNATGTRLFAGNWEKSIQVWDATTGQPAMPPLPHKGLSTYTALLLSPSGQWLASLSLENTVRIWDAESGKLVFPELRHSSAANVMAFTSDSRHLAVGCLDGTAYLWDLRHEEPVCVQLKQSRKVYAVSFSPDNRLLLTGSSDGTVRIWDWDSEALSCSPWAETPLAVLEVGSEKSLLTQNSDRSLQLWEAGSWKPVSGSIPVSNVVSRAWLNQDETRLLTLSETSSVDSAIHSQLEEGKGTERVASLAKPAASQTIANRQSATAWLTFQSWEPSSSRRVSTMTLSADARYSVWASHDCRLIALAQSNRVTFCDSIVAKRVWERQMGAGAIRYVAFNAKKALAAVMAGPEAQIVDTATGKIACAPLKFNSLSMCAAFSPDGKLLATASGDEFVVDREACVWDADTGRALTPSMEHNGAISSISFSPDGRRIATASHDRTARVWDSQTGQPMVPPLRHLAGVTYATFSSDSHWLATFTEDGAARIWDADTGEPLTPPFKHPAGLSYGCFLAGARHLFTQGEANMVAIWELPRDLRPVKDWLSLASMLSARRINPGGFLELASAESLSNSWQSLRTRYEKDFRPAHGFTSLKSSPGTSPPPSPIRPVPQ